MGGKTLIESEPSQNPIGMSGGFLELETHSNVVSTAETSPKSFFFSWQYENLQLLLRGRY